MRLLYTILADDPLNFEILMRESDIGILFTKYLSIVNPFSKSIEELIFQLFSEKVSQNEVKAYESLEKVMK
jgi:hypothetical protein